MFRWCGMSEGRNRVSPTWAIRPRSVGSDVRTIDLSASAVVGIMTKSPCGLDHLLAHRGATPHCGAAQPPHVTLRAYESCSLLNSEFAQKNSPGVST